MATQADIAEHIDLSERQVRNLIADGVLPDAERGGLDIDACRVAYIRYLREASARPARNQAFDEERMRVARANADRVEFDNRVRQSEFVPVAECGALLRHVAAEMANQMAGLPGRIAGEIAGISDPAIVRSRLKDECSSVRSAIAKHLGALAAIGEGASEGSGTDS